MNKRKSVRVLKEPAKPADKQQAPLEKKPEALKKNQVPQRSNEIKEEAKNTKEVKAKENIRGGIKEEFKASAEYRDQNPSFKSKYNNYSSIKKMTGRFGEEEVQQIVEQIEAIDLVKFLKAKGHPYFPKRIVDSKKIIKTIEYWLQYLNCSVKDCPYNAIITYQGESSDQIYCQMHADPSKHMTERIVFQNELTESEPLLRELEKDLLYSQAKMIIAKEENEGDKIYESIIEDLENKFSVIKSTLNTMKGKVENLIEKPNTKKATNKNEVFRYRSLSFIMQDCEKCSEINDEILSIISKTSRKKKIELFVGALDNECKGIQIDEEFKSCPYYEVPDEIYEKEFNILRVPFQSKILVNYFEKKIKDNFKIIVNNQKTAEQLAANLNSDKHTLEAKLAEYQSQSKIKEGDKDQSQKPSYSEKEKKTLKELSFRDAQFYSEKLGISQEEFKTIFAKSSEIYSKLGQFQYHQPDLTSTPIQQLTFTTTNGMETIYLGQLKEGTSIREGIGIAVYSNGVIYEGCWKNDYKEGKGRHISNDGRYYIGDCKDNYKHGNGIFYYADGNRYEGEWKDNNRHGKCVYYFADGNRYEGEYRDGDKNGQGTFYWTDGEKYTGEWKDGRMNGQGTYYYKDGSWWIGEWKNGKNGTKNGLGTEYAAGGAVLRSGNWVNGKYVEPK